VGTLAVGEIEQSVQPPSPAFEGELHGAWRVGGVNLGWVGRDWVGRAVARLSRRRVAPDDQNGESKRG
jgi:hypothetical protein